MLRKRTGFGVSLALFCGLGVGAAQDLQTNDPDPIPAAESVLDPMPVSTPAATSVLDPEPEAAPASVLEPDPAVASEPASNSILESAPPVQPAAPARSLAETFESTKEVARPVPATTTRKPPVERMRTAPTDYLIFQRAAYLAQQRTERMEGRKWAGISTARPQVPRSALYNDLNASLLPVWDWRYRLDNYRGW